MSFERLYAIAAQSNPNITFAQYDAAWDQTPQGFIALAGDDTPVFENIKRNHEDISRVAQNFRFFVSDNTSHTILTKPEFYEYAVDQIRFVDWFTRLVSGRSIDNVLCDPCVAMQP